MRKTIWNKRIPTILGILFIAISVGITSFLVKQGTLFVTKASPSSAPKDIRITNVSDTSFTVSYTTDGSVPGSINFGKDKNLGQTLLDDRDQSQGLLSPHSIHSITLKNLTPQTSYFFIIISGQDTYLNNNSPFQATTGPTITSSATNQKPLVGKVVSSDGTLTSDAVLYATLDNGQVLSTLIKNDGGYILPLNSLRTQDLSSYYQFKDSDKIKLLIEGTSGVSSTIITSVAQINPVPTVTLSQNYDFTQSTPSASISGQLSGFPSINISTPSASPSILSPKNNQNLTDQQPLFQGTGIPNQSVKIIIKSNQEINTTVATDANGNWTYRPSTPLDPGTHTISVIAPDGSGILREITQTFTVYASGTQIPGTSTGAGQTPSPQLTMTSTPSPSPSITPTPTPTPVLSPTPQASSSAKKTLPPTGNPFIVNTGLVGLAATILGGIIFAIATSFPF